MMAEDSCAWHADTPGMPAHLAANMTNGGPTLPCIRPAGTLRCGAHGLVTESVLQT